MHAFAPSLPVPLGAMSDRDMSALARAAAGGDRKGALRHARFAELTQLRERYLSMRGSRQLSGIQIWMPQMSRELDTAGAPSLGALSPGATNTVDATMRELDALEEQVYTELALAVSSGADVDQANAEYDNALSQLVKLETVKDAMSDDDMPAWKLEAARVRVTLTEFLRQLREMNKEHASQGQISSLFLGLSVAAVVGTAAAIILTRGRGRRRRR